MKNLSNFIKFVQDLYNGKPALKAPKPQNFDVMAAIREQEPPYLIRDKLGYVQRQIKEITQDD